MNKLVVRREVIDNSEGVANILCTRVNLGEWNPAVRKGLWEELEVAGVDGILGQGSVLCAVAEKVCCNASSPF